MSALVNIAGDALARATGMTSAQARGTLRLLLKDRGVDPSITRKADLIGLLGRPLDEALAKRHVTAGPAAFPAVRRAIADADEHEDALDLFGDLD